jgi:DNA polymerase-3 subunit delta
MVAIKSHQANAFLKDFKRPISAVLFYGTDAGLVSERAAALAKRLAERDDPPGEIIRVDDTSLEDDPDRIYVELKTAPMFGGAKVVRALTGRRVTAAALKPLLEGGDLEGHLIVEAGSLRPDDALRTLFEKSGHAAAVACFPDEARDLQGVVGEVLSAAKLEITPEARTLLVARLGADRAMSRAEIEKLALYAHGKGRIEESDIEAAVGDAAEQALDRVVMAAGGGQVAAALAECDRSIAAGEDAQAVIAALQRHFLRLHRMRAGLDAGRSMDEVVRSLRPPPLFNQRDALEAQCQAWSAGKLTSALGRIAETAKAARLSPTLEGTLAERLLLDVGALANDKRANPPLP